MSENEPTQDTSSSSSSSSSEQSEASETGSKNLNESAVDGDEVMDSDDVTEDDESESGSESVEAKETKEEKEKEESAESPSADLVERVEDSDPEQIAREIESLREQEEERQETIAGLESSVKRQQAEFQNYKKRQEKRRRQERKRATEDLVTRLIDVRDNLKRGLEQEGDIRDGVETTLRQFDEILGQENVTEISPEPGDDVNPQRHEVLLRVESDQPADTIDSLHRSGYEMADTVIRAAQVTVSDSSEDEDNEGDE